MSLIFIMGLMLMRIFCVDVETSVPELPNVEIQDTVPRPDPVPRQDIFVEAERITGCPAEILRGLAGTESYFIVDAVGDDGLSHGMFQLHSRWHASRVEKYGEFDPFNPSDAAIIAGYIIQENLRVFNGDLRLAVAAYKQGATGVTSNGVIDWYVDEVLSWRNNQEKVIAFFIFQGITELGGMEDGHDGFRTQVAYQPDDTPPVQISGWGSSRFSY
jgi:hypothetical protein